MIRMRLLTAVALLAAWQADARADSGVEFFEKKIRPVLAEHCYRCHSREANKRKGNLLLDTRDGLLKGGDSGPALVVGKGEVSLIVKALRYEKLEMPPTGRLDAAVVADFVRWIDMGAPDPRVVNAAATKVTPKEGGTLWSLKPVRKPSVPSVKDTTWPRTDVDRFLLARLEEAGLAPADDADPLPLLRRLHFALVGLPASADEQAAFEKAAALDRSNAIAAEVDRLLASPHFGEQWARHWMDLVCYSETHGIEHDPYIPNMWRYRDYLIRAFNADVPYDRLVREHLAGDLLEPRWNRELGINESPIGTAIFRFVELYPTPVDPKAEENSVLELQIDTFGKTFQGLTLACARCHDHKFDPISARDYHALYGIFASGRTAMHVVDDPKRLHAYDADLTRIKSEIRRELSGLWRRELERWPAEFSSETKDPARKTWRDAVLGATDKPHHVLYPLTAKDKNAERDLAEHWHAARKRATASNADQRLFADFSQGDAAGWHVHGQCWAQTSAAGDFALQASGEQLLTGIYPRGRYTHLVSERHPGALRSPSFTIDMKYISVLACGTNDARIRLIVENFPGDELLFAPVMPKLKGGEMRWLTLPIRTQHWQGRRAYLEIIPRDDMTYGGRVPDTSKIPTDGRSGVGVRRVVFHDAPKGPESISPLPDSIWQGDAPPMARFQRVVAAALDAWQANACDDEQAQLLDTLVRLGLLTNQAPAQHRLAKLLTEFRTLEAKVPVPHRVVGLVEEEGADVPFYPRGNYRLAKDRVPRRYLTVMNGLPYSLKPRDSGRLQLADELVRPDNPLTARVMVNRIWQQLFGAGLVRSVDNFGQLGDAPSHPELLDHLASEFIAQKWSIKAMIRALVLSRAYQLSSRANARLVEADPDNRLCGRAAVRRLQAEEIRDSLLAVSGRLDRKPFGLGVAMPPLAFKDFYPLAAGPLDGAGRRSIYLEVRRNYPSPFLTVFDWPRPLATTGLRNVTNVPAQGLTLLNDPFVLQQADLFAQRSAHRDSPVSRIELMYRLALGRPPAPAERERALAFVRNETDAPNAWRQLAHALFNMKEFVFTR